MKKTMIILLLFNCIILNAETGNRDSVQDLKIEKIKEANKAVVREYKAEIEKLDTKIKSLESTRENILWFPLAALAIISLIIFFLRKRVVNAIIKETISDILAKKIKVDTDVLESTLKDLAKDYDARFNRKFLVLSKNETDEIQAISATLKKGGFSRDNFEYKNIDSNSFEFKGVSLIVFNDKYVSSLSIEEMSSFIQKHKDSVNAYFYFGPNRIPLNEWRENYKIEIGAANLEDALPRNLIGIFKNID